MEIDALLPEALGFLGNEIRNISLGRKGKFYSKCQAKKDSITRNVTGIGEYI